MGVLGAGALLVYTLLSGGDEPEEALPTAPPAPAVTAPADAGVAQLPPSNPPPKKDKRKLRKRRHQKRKRRHTR